MWVLISMFRKAIKSQWSIFSTGISTINNQELGNKHQKGNDLYLQQHPRGSAGRESSVRPLRWRCWNRRRQRAPALVERAEICAVPRRRHRGIRKSWSCAEQFHWEPDFVGGPMSSGLLIHSYVWRTRYGGTNLFFKIGALIGRHGVGLGQDGDDVDFIVEPFHKFDVEWLEAVTRRLDEIEADVNAVIAHWLALHPRLGVQVLFIFGFDIVHDRLPTKKKEKVTR